MAWLRWHYFMTVRSPSMVYDPGLNLRAVPHIRWRCYKQGGILLNTLTGEVYKLNRSGMRIWQLLTEGHNPKAIVPMIVHETGAETSLVEADIDCFVVSMLEQGVLCSSNAVDGSRSEAG
jgi:hypothetical protein